MMGIGHTEKYLKDCVKIVFDSPNKSREKVNYTKKQIETIRNKKSLFPSVNKYQI